MNATGALGIPPRPYQRVRHAIAAGLAAGDLDATKAACRQWCRLVIAWTRDYAVSGEVVAP
jgi:hypothetical protein